jgi:hypothetical protein
MSLSFSIKTRIYYCELVNSTIRIIEFSSVFENFLRLILQISIRTNYTGPIQNIIESQITEPLEKAINSIDGIETLPPPAHGAVVLR